MFATVQTNLGVFLHEVDRAVVEFIEHLNTLYKYHRDVKISIKKTAPSLV